MENSTVKESARIAALPILWSFSEFLQERISLYDIKFYLSSDTLRIEGETEPYLFQVICYLSSDIRTELKAQSSIQLLEYRTRTGKLASRFPVFF